jgi:non-ribosomal peptide synthetase component F
VHAHLAEALRKLGRGEGATLFMTLLAGLDVLLHRYTEAGDVVIGSGAANRLRPEMEPLIGCFFNMLVLRADLADRPTFRELLARVRETTLGAYAHQALPFDWLIQAWQRARADRDARLFHMLFELQDGLAGSAAPDDLTFTWLDSKPGVVKYDLALFVREQDGELLGDLEYNADLFSPGWIETLLEDFRLVLDEVAWNPDRAVDAIELGAGSAELENALMGDLELD